MADERRPKNEPTFDTQALMGVSDAELAQARRPRPSKGGRLPWPWIGAGAGVILLGIGVAAWIRGREPEVVSMPLATPTEVSAPDAGVALAPLPDPSRAPASPAPVSVAPTSVAPVERAASAKPREAAPPVDPRTSPRAGAPGSAKPRAASGPDDVDRALERLSTQSGDQLAAAGSFDGARTAYASECAAGKAASCARWGALLADGKGGPQDEGGARDAYGQACRMRSAEGCIGMSRLVEGRAALEALEAACDLASAAGCRAAAEHVEANGGGEARVISLRARACALGDRASCATAKTSSTVD